jgi:2-amino-4-hydroxy-6-hydroxymethyldihydropteridine diphosphokinase
MRAWVGLGGNTGDPVATLRAAFTAIAALPETELLRQSSLYRTPAWGPVAQPDYINAVGLLETRLDAGELLAGLLEIERAFGRLRLERWGPRSLDLDLLLYGDEVIDVPGLRVPHPHLHERAFRRGIGAERQVGDQQRALQAARDARDVVRDIGHRDRQRAVVALHHHAE